MLDADIVAQTINIVRKTYGRLVEKEHHRAFDTAISTLRASRKLYDDATDKEYLTWGYTIKHDGPVRFTQSSIMAGIKPQADIYCDIQWKDGDLPVKQDLKIRIWSRHRQTIFRSNLDASQLENTFFHDPARTIYPGRVVSRFHFDKVNFEQGRSQQYHPEYHMQAGGIPMDYEYCWHPASFDIPRIGFQPMDLALAVQLVAINFFPDEYSRIKNKAEWKNYLIHHQKWLLRDYYLRCYTDIENGASLFDALQER